MRPQHTPAPDVADFGNADLADDKVLTRGKRQHHWDEITFDDVYGLPAPVNELISHTPYTEQQVWCITTPQGTKMVPNSKETNTMQKPSHYPSHLDEDWFVEPEESQQLRDIKIIHDTIAAKLESDRQARHWNERVSAFVRKTKHNRKVAKLARKARRK